MKFRWSGPALLIASAVMIIGIVTLITQLLTAKLLAAAHDQDYQLMRNVSSSLIKSAEDRAITRADLVISMPAVRNAFIARDRPKLLAECAKMYEIQDKKYGLDQAQFHVPPGVSFLRLHKPEVFGDEQTSYRPMLSDVHQTKMIRKGTALTKRGPAIFGIAPVFDDSGKFVGSFEMGLEFSPILAKMKEAYGLEAAVFFDEKQLKEISTDLSGDVMQPKNRVGKYIRFDATHTDLAVALINDKDVEITEPKHYERVVAGVPYGVQLIPLYNYANKQIGVIAMASNFGEDKTRARRAMIWEILAAVIGTILLAGVIIVTLRGVLIVPLASLNERFAALAAGDASRPAESNDTLCEELETLSASYERLRTGTRS